MTRISANDTVKSSGYNGEAKDPLFNVHSIYLKDASFEAPEVPLIFNEEWKPKVDFDMQMGSKLLAAADNIYEVVLHITVTVKLGEGQKEKLAFLVEIQQAGAFTVRNLQPEEQARVLATTCAAVLFPFARENLASLATRGGFPQLLLPPINFDVMYAHHLAQVAKETSIAVTT